MKRLLKLTFLAVYVLWTGKSTAQEFSITGIRPQSFSGIKLAGQGERYYVAFMDVAAQDSANVRLKVFDRGLQPTIDIGIPMAKGTELAGYTYTGQFYLLQLVNAGNKTRTTIAIDDAGNLFKRKDETDIKAVALTPANFPSIYPVGMNEVLMLRTTRDGKPALEIEMWDLELQSRWQKNFDEGSAAELVRLQTENDRVYLLKKQKHDGKNVYAIQSVSGTVGDIFYNTELREAEKIAIPSYLDVQQGFLTTAGIFQNETDARKAEGVFYGRLSHEGRPEKMNFIPWAAIKTQVKSATVAELESGKMGLLIHTAVPDVNDEGTTLIGELYKKTTGTEPNTAVFSVQDFVLIHFNREGQPDRFTQISKPQRELQIKGNMSSKTDVELAQWLQKNNFFAYRALTPVVGKNVLTYFNNEGKGTVYFATIDSSGTVPKTGIMTVSLDRQAEAESAKNKDRNKDREKASLTVLNSTEKDINEFVLAQTAKGVIPTHEGHVLIYNYSDPDLNFWIIPVQTQ